MKHYVLLMMVLLFTISSCKKDSFNEPESNISIQEKSFGGRPDNPELLKNFEFKASKEFIENGRTVAFTKNGKKIHDLSIEEANALMTDQAKGGKSPKWGGGGSTGGGTTGGGGTTTQTDFTPPYIVGVDPATGTNYTLNQHGYIDMRTHAFVKDDVKLARVQIRLRGVVILDSSTNLLPNTYNSISKYSPWIFGDGTYDIVWQAWDAAGNTTQVTTVVSRNTQMTPLPSNFPSSYILPHPKRQSNPPATEPDGDYIQQGGEGSCAAFAVASAYTIQRYVRSGQTGGFNNNNVYSPEWVYNIALRGSSCGYGSSVIGNIGIIKSRGVPTWGALPYSAFNGCDTLMFTDAIRANAATNTTNWGAVISTADRNAIKQQIYNGYVSPIGVFADGYWVNNPAPGFIWNSFHPNQGLGGAHAAAIIGYDDSKNAYLLLNSWGLNWGDQGTIWVDYDFFENGVKSGSIYYMNH